MVEQLVFNLPVRHALGRNDFFISPSNSSAVNALDNWQDWPLRKMILIGKIGSGKTHLAQIWAQSANATIIPHQDLLAKNIDMLAQNNICVEDVSNIKDNETENLLFHLHNRIYENGKTLLLTGRMTPNTWNITLPDLKSRLFAAGLTKLENPDDALLTAVIIKQFEDRQITIEPRVLNYLLSRIERSFEFVTLLVQKLDETALIKRKPITLRLAANVLDGLI